MTTMALPETTRGREYSGEPEDAHEPGYSLLRAGVVADLWSDAPSGGEAWRQGWHHTQPADLPAPSGAQCSHSIKASGGVIVAVVIAGLASLGTAAGAGVRTSDMFTAAPTLTLPAARRHDQEEAGVVAVGGATIAVADLPAAVTAADQVEAVQAALSLSVTQIADVIRVKRATVHNWLRSDSPAPRSEAAGDRLRRLYRVAASWRDRSSHDPRAFVAVPLGDGQPSLLDLLRADVWDDGAIERALATLANLLDERAAERAERVVEHDAEIDNREDALAVERERVRSAVARARRFVIG
ncbi:hypothetical protein tb265_06860 [Gemmatimonadetes bacterium T265]|nr:hypothetical protein tb265_06860 [Gemmatimonadetes bacterium T265]